MNPGRFFMPNYIGNMGVPTYVPNFSPIGRITSGVSPNAGIFSKITNGIRSVNWGGLLNNANKTLNFVNQAIPLVRQTGPMINNMKSMFRIAKAFGNETTGYSKKRNINSKTNTNIIDTKQNFDNIDEETISQKKEVSVDNHPNFFI